jgi:hypothetical protein
MAGPWLRRYVPLDHQREPSVIDLADEPCGIERYCLAASQPARPFDELTIDADVTCLATRLNKESAIQLADLHGAGNVL